MINVNRLQTNSNGNIFNEGYRIVYFYENDYKIGTYVKNIEDFMMDFVLIEPIDDNTDIPKFISNENLLDRYLNDLPNTIGVAIYKVDGTLVLRKDRINC